ncbi:poly [ADP-ribose] polymerase tankyrase-like [Oscarella lobularis]|uniref:poly [ADP-ribose] polymerase tankyrase-like n=1 Tax=Oscarella lobularis TaxID=121494 RepID=UPI0033131B56
MSLTYDKKAEAQKLAEGSLRELRDRTSALAAQLSPEMRKEWDNACLFWSSMKDNEEICKYMLENGADPNWISWDGMTSLHYAAASGRTSILKLLLSSSCIRVEAEDDWGFTSLCYAASRGKEECVRELLGAGASREHRTKSGESPYDLASKGGFDDVATALKV